MEIVSSALPSLRVNMSVKLAEKNSIPDFAFFLRSFAFELYS